MLAQGLGEDLSSALVQRLWGLILGPNTTVSSPSAVTFDFSFRPDTPMLIKNITAKSLWNQPLPHFHGLSSALITAGLDYRGTLSVPRAVPSPASLCSQPHSVVPASHSSGFPQPARSSPHPAGPSEVLPNRADGPLQSHRSRSPSHPVQQ